MLRFGDGTPFPHDEGFLEVLVDVVSACTEMLTVTADMEDRHERARQKQHELLEEELKLERFEESVRVAATPSTSMHRPKPTHAELAFRRTVAAMQHAVKHSREQLKLAAEANAAELAWDESAQQVEVAAGGFFEHHVLPGMIWSWSWNAMSTTPGICATARGTRFTVEFELEHDAMWHAPIRISELASEVMIELPRRRWFGKPIVAPVSLDRCVLVEARCGTEERSLVIQERAKASPSWRIVLPRDGDASVTAFDRRGRAIAACAVAPVQVTALFDAIDLQVRARLHERTARAVMLGDAQVSAIPDTTAAPRALLDEISPIVREIRSRSRVPGELSIKRDVAAGVREELFVSRTELAACYASLPPQYRHLLDAIGVGRGLTEVLSDCGTGATTVVQPEAVPEALPYAVTPPVPRTAPTTTPHAVPPVPHTVSATMPQVTPPKTPPAMPVAMPHAAPTKTPAMPAAVPHAALPPVPRAVLPSVPRAVPQTVPPPTPQRADTHPPVPRRASAHTPTVPVQSLSAIPVRNSAAITTSWMPLRPATPLP